MDFFIAPCLPRARSPHAISSEVLGKVALIEVTSSEAVLKQRISMRIREISPGKITPSEVGFGQGHWVISSVFAQSKVGVKQGRWDQAMSASNEVD